MVTESEKRCIIDSLKWKYWRSGKKGKGVILTEVIERIGVCRKRAIRLMSRRQRGRPEKRKKAGCKPKYQDAAFIGALRKVWRESKYMCSRNLKAAMPEWLAGLETLDGSFADDVHERLLKISASTIDRLLHPYKAEHGVSFTRPGSILRNEIPIQGNEWDITVPGYMEADTVAHCGGSLLGEFIFSLTMTDIATAWTEVRALWGKGAAGTLAAIKDVEKVIPFKLLGFDSDNGSEFLNYHLLRYFRQEHPNKNIKFTRSREYHKNDNAHVEQKNWSIPRRYLGYDRLDFQELLPMVNSYYKDIINPLNNHFIPALKIKDKVLLKSRFRRVYEAPVTPYKRVMSSEYVSQEVKDKLKAEHESLNPVHLARQESVMRKKIDSVLRALKGQKLGSSSVKNLSIPSDLS